MRFSTTSGAIGVLAITIGLVAGTTADSSELKQGTTPQVAQASESTAARTPLLLAKEEAERRIRRVMGGALAIIKVDRRNGGLQGSSWAMRRSRQGRQSRRIVIPRWTRSFSCMPGLAPPNSVTEPPPSDPAQRYTSHKRLV